MPVLHLLVLWECFCVVFVFIYLCSSCFSRYVSSLCRLNKNDLIYIKAKNRKNKAKEKKKREEEKTTNKENYNYKKLQYFLLRTPRLGRASTNILWQTHRTHRHLLNTPLIVHYSSLHSMFIVSPRFSYVMKYLVLHSICFVFFNYKASLL